LKLKVITQKSLEAKKRISPYVAAKAVGEGGFEGYQEEGEET